MEHYGPCTSWYGIICVTSFDIGDTDYIISFIDDMHEFHDGVALSLVDFYTRVTAREP